MKTIRNSFLDKKLIGTLFEEEEITQKNNIHNQEARNEKGGKHFHGAFTGGFQAGYKNTCGSRDGWAPQTFVSSRNNRATYQAQTLESFMDEEDVGRRQIGINLTIAEEFDSFGIRNITLLQQKSGIDSNFGYAPTELLNVKDSSIGQQILRDIKFKKIKNRIKEGFDVELPDDNEEYNPQLPLTNDNNSGLGYKKIFEENSSSQAETLYLQFMKRFNNPIDEFDEIKRKKENRITFNGGDENNQEEYNFEIEEEQLFGKNPKKKVKLSITDKKSSLEDVFIKVENQYVQEETKYTIEVPKDYDPYHRVRQMVKEGFDMNKMILKKREDPKRKRRELFEEEELVLKDQTATQIRQDIDRKKFVKSTDSEIIEKKGVKELYPHDSLKQQRFEHFVWEKQGKLVSGITPNSKLTQDEQEDEKEEFERMFNMFHTDSKHYVKKEETVKEVKVEDPKAAFYCKRKSRKWVPQGMVSMRLGVPSPYNEEEARQIIKTNKKNKEEKQEPKEKFRSGGVYKEGEDEILDPSLLNTRFDPSQLGLPLSFKSTQIERNSRDFEKQQISQMQQLAEARETKKEFREREMNQPLEAIEVRNKDKTLFESIFGDD